jgi:23S rRNA (guanosine2251-2'-O)-methyltransferase
MKPRRPDRPARPDKLQRPPERESKSANLLYGFHAVRQAWLNPARSIRRLFLTPAGLETFAPALEEAKRKKLPRPNPEQVERERLDQMLPGAVHQGIALDCAPLDFATLDDVLRATSSASSAVIVALDQVTDPHNVGAILRSAAAFGAAGVIVPERNAPPLTGVLAKTASGAVDAIPLVRVANLARALDELKEDGFWTVGLAEEGKQTLAEADMSGKVVLVLGAEGDGLRRLTTERCDLLVRLPTLPPIGSLNVSNAAAVALYELARKRS